VIVKFFLAVGARMSSYQYRCIQFRDPVALDETVAEIGAGQSAAGLLIK